MSFRLLCQFGSNFHFHFHLEISNMAYRWPPDSFWQWLPTASVEALKVAKDVFESEIAYKEAQEKEAFLQFWKDHPVPCNRCCPYYHGDQKCPFPCAHTSTDPDQWMSHSANEWHRCAAHWFLQFQSHAFVDWPTRTSESRHTSVAEFLQNVPWRQHLPISAGFGFYRLNQKLVRSAPIRGCVCVYRSRP